MTDTKINFWQSKIDEYKISVEALAVLSKISTIRLQQIVLNEKPPNPKELEKLAYAFSIPVPELRLKLAQANYPIDSSDKGLSDSSQDQFEIEVNQGGLHKKFLTYIREHNLSDESLSVLLNTDIETIKAVKAGKNPEPKLLKQICICFNLNYKEMFSQLNYNKNLVPSSNLEAPLSKNIIKLRTTLKSIEQLLKNNASAEIFNSTLAQLDFIEKFLTQNLAKEFTINDSQNLEN